MGTTQGLWPDYSARWTAGRLLLTGHLDQLYDPAVQASLQHGELGTSGLSWFVSPPFVAGLFAPLATLPYALSCAVWTVSSLASLLLALKLLRPWAPPVLASRWRLFVVIVCSSYPVVELVGGGQDTAVVLLAVVAGMRLVEAGHLLTGGALLALGCMKPQLVFLIPLLLLVQRRFRAVAGFLGTVLLLLTASLLMVGVDGVGQWLRLPTSPHYVQAVQLDQAWKSVSASAWLTAVAPSSWGSTWQSLATAAGLVLVIPGLRAMRGARPSSATGWVITLTTTVVASPHVMAYDLVLLIPAVVLLAGLAWTAATRTALAGIYTLSWTITPLHALAGAWPWPLDVVGSPWVAVPLVVLWASALSPGPRRVAQPRSSAEAMPPYLPTTQSQQDPGT
ncbi:glycosyltransferase family 87 protein [Terrabacter sp. BE26]|uniref:glycosyltransferase family 87 protein n=1 Tax=Terrabacter sp. BE26 TaxID=2898152 RepID=UPI0035BE1AA5